MRAGAGAVVLNGDPKIVIHRRVQRQHTERPGVDGINIGGAAVAIEIVQVQAGVGEVEGGAGAGVLDRVVQRKADDHAAASRLPDGEHALAATIIDPAIGSVGEFKQRVRSRRQARAEGKRHAIVQNAGGISGFTFEREIVGKIEAAVVARKACCGGDRIFDGQDAIAGLDAARLTHARSTTEFIP